MSVNKCDVDFHPSCLLLSAGIPSVLCNIEVLPPNNQSPRFPTANVYALKSATGQGGSCYDKSTGMLLRLHIKFVQQP